MTNRQTETNSSPSSSSASSKPSNMKENTTPSVPVTCYCNSKPNKTTSDDRVWVQATLPPSGHAGKYNPGPSFFFYVQLLTRNFLKLPSAKM